jgi:hypothetical protein
MLAVAVSLALCAAFAALWLRSYSGATCISRSRVHNIHARSFDSRVRVALWTVGSLRLIVGEQHSISGAYPDVDWKPLIGQKPPARWNWYRFTRADPVGWVDPPVRSFWNRLGFHHYPSGTSASFLNEDYDIIAFPAWLPVTVFALPPAAYVRRLVTRAKARCRQRKNLCPACGYDLRATPDRCPECGLAPRPVN